VTPVAIDMPAWLALLPSLSFMGLSSMAGFGTLTIVSERLKWGRKAEIVSAASRAQLLAGEAVAT
jgi:hypothetical protein